MNQIEKDRIEIPRQIELTGADAKLAIYQAELIVNSQSDKEMITRDSHPRLVDRIRAQRGLIMGTLGVAGGVIGMVLATTLFPDQHSALYNLIISPQHGMGALGVAAGTSLGEVLTRG